MEQLRNIPKLDDFLNSSAIDSYHKRMSHEKIMAILRETVDETRNDIIKGSIKPSGKGEIFESIEKLSIEKMENYLAEGLRRVINATGIVIHTNLGRAPIARAAAEIAAELASGYSNLEYSHVSGERRSRLQNIEKMLTDLTGAEGALVVNNNAAAVFLALDTFCNGKEAILSRGEIVEIGDSFRISEIMEASGCKIKEVGTTNKTKLSDYENAVNENTTMLLKVHTSNFTIIGFTGSVTTKELMQLSARKNIPLMEDMGSGVLVDLAKHGYKYERRVQDAVKDGAHIITFSGDKMLGASQAGIIVGKKEYIEKMKKNQLLRCLRVDKLCLAALEYTLTQYFNGNSIKNIPVYEYLTTPLNEIEEKASALSGIISKANKKVLCEAKKCIGRFGGGALPEENIESYGVYIRSSFYTPKVIDEHLRRQSIPIITTIQKDEIIIDVRTIDTEDFQYIGEVFGRLGLYA